MGTRNLTIVHSNGEYKVAQYGQWDGYPEGLGVQLLKYLKGININELRNAVNDCTYLSKEDFDEINKNIDEARKDNPRFSWQKFYPELSRDTGGDILELIMFKNKTKLQNSLNFAADSLFCEWAYVIDLDKNTYEVYEGFNKEPLDESERFYFLTPIAEKEYRENPKNIILLNLLQNIVLVIFLTKKIFSKILVKSVVLMRKSRFGISVFLAEI